MIHFTDITGLASSAIATTAIVVRLPGMARLRRTYLALLAGMVMVAALVPFGGLPLAAYVRGVTGDLSITSLVLLMLMVRCLFAPVRTPSPPGGGLEWGSDSGRYALQCLIALAAAGLYPMALGFGFFDPYRLGYGDPWLMAGLLAVALAAHSRRRPVMALAIALAVLAWSVGWYESGNLWDYLLDPLLAIYAISALVKRGVQYSLKPRNNTH